MATLKEFQEKENQIKKALVRVQKIIQQLKSGKRDPEQWNNVTDLRVRLNNRLFINWSEYKDWHFNKYGFNIYNF